MARPRAPRGWSACCASAVQQLPSAARRSSSRRCEARTPVRGSSRYLIAWPVGSATDQTPKTVDKLLHSARRARGWRVTPDDLGDLVGRDHRIGMDEQCREHEPQLRTPDSVRAVIDDDSVEGRRAPKKNGRARPITLVSCRMQCSAPPPRAVLVTHGHSWSVEDRSRPGQYGVRAGQRVVAFAFTRQRPQVRSLHRHSYAAGHVQVVSSL